MKGCAGPVEATPTPRHRHPGDLEPADSGGIECAVSNFWILRQDSLADFNGLYALGPDGRRLSSEPGIQRTGRRSSLRHCPPSRIHASPLFGDGPLSAPSLQIHQTTSNTRMATCLND